MPEQPVSSDLLVVLPGIMGSTLASRGALVWAPSARAAIRAVRRFGTRLTQLALPPGIGDDRPDDQVEPVALMPDLHLLPGLWTANIGYGRLLERLRTRYHFVEARQDDPDRIPNLLPVAYDWRLSNRFNGRRLKGIVEPALDRWRSQGGRYAEAKVVFLCHSMGGLVARWYIEREGGLEVTRKLVTLGTPFRGAMKSLEQLVNGVRKGIRPFRFDLTAFARSLPSVHQLLPEYACIESGDKVLKTSEAELPELEARMVADGMRFHEELDEASATHDPNAYDVHPIVGTRQRTATTARIANGRVKVADRIDGQDEGGDATVPRLSARMKSLRGDSPTLRWVADKHGSLQSNVAVLDEIDGILTANPIPHRGSAGMEVRVDVEEVLFADERVEILAIPDERIQLAAEVLDERGRQVAARPLVRATDGYRTALGPLAPGAYQVVVGGVGPMRPLVAPVTSAIFVWDERRP